MGRKGRWFACPECGSRDAMLAGANTEDAETMEGFNLRLSFLCENCGATEQQGWTILE